MVANGAREALVNQIIHQDYNDASAAAQVELSRTKAVFFNTGHSLVSHETLVEGGRSESRNPLVARAMRLVGFAELAGSGIRALQYAWREANRRPPSFELDRESNTFSLTLDWRAIPNAYDDMWRNMIGVELTEGQADVLNLATDDSGVTAHQAAAGIGVTVDEAREILRVLQYQVLVEQREGHFYLKPHIKEALT